MKKLIEELQKKRCYNSIKISRDAPLSGGGEGTGQEAQSALDDAIDKATMAATEKVTKFANEWCAKGRCTAGECHPSIDFTVDVSGKEIVIPEPGKKEKYSFAGKVTATGQISCKCEAS